MPILLLVICFLLLTFLNYNTSSTTSRIESLFLPILKSVILLSAFVILSVEVASFFDILTAQFIKIAWLVLAILLLFRVYSINIFQQQFKIYINTFNDLFRVRDKESKVILYAVILLMLIPLLFLSIYCPPNNMDSMTYHLTRVQFWIQNKNVKFYQTQFQFQLFYNVLSEYWLLTTILLSDSDLFVNVIQYFSMLGSALTVVLITGIFGVDLRSKVFVFIFCITLPIGVLESTTTQNDYLSAYFFLNFLYFCLLLIQHKKLEWSLIFWCVTSIILGGFTKYTAFLFAVPFCVWLTISIIKNVGLFSAIKVGLFAVFLFCLVFFPFFYRNYQTFGSILSPLPTSTFYAGNAYTVEHISIEATLSTMIKNAGIHLGLPITSYNQQIKNIVEKAHELLHYSSGDLNSSLGEYQAVFTLTEDRSGNFFHFWIITFGFVLLGLSFFRKSFQKSQKYYGVMVSYAILLFVGLLIYSAIFKWQWFHSRTQISFFLASAPFLVLLFRNFLKSTVLYRSSVSLLVLLALPYVYVNPKKTILPVRYLVKKTLGYVPIELDNHIPAILKNPVILKFYHTKDNKVWTLDGGQSYSTKITINQILADAGFYNEDMLTVFTGTRFDKYFFGNVSQNNDLVKIAEILDKNGGDKTIGIVYKSHTMLVYPFWKLPQTNQGKNTFEYIYYSKEIKDVYNQNKPYSYIISTVSPKKLAISDNDIKKIYRLQDYFLIELSRPSTKTYYWEEYKFK